MVSADLRAQADRRFEEALAARGARDPREFYRTQLRALRERDPRAFDEAVRHYETQLLPAVAAEDTDPLEAWLEYGRRLAQLTAPGRTVQVDGSGRARPYTTPIAPDALVLHLPDSAREPVIPVGLPPRLTGAQRATYDLLVAGKLALERQ